MEISERLKRRARQGGALAVLILIGIVLFFQSARGWLNSNEGAVAGILSLLLVMLYFGQYRLLSRQLRLENRPHVEIQEYDEEGRELHVWLSNLGNGVASDLEIETRVDFEPTENFRPATATSRLRKVGEEGDKKKSVGNSLQSGEQKVRFVGEPSMGLQLEDRVQHYGPRSGTRTLTSDGVERIRIEFYVKNSDLLGDFYWESVYGRYPLEVELGEEGLNMEKLFAQSVPTIDGSGF